MQLFINFLGILLMMQFAELLMVMKLWRVSRHTGELRSERSCQPFELPFARINEACVLSRCWQLPETSGATQTVLWACQPLFYSLLFPLTLVTGGEIIITFGLPLSFHTWVWGSDGHSGTCFIILNQLRIQLLDLYYHAFMAHVTLYSKCGEQFNSIMRKNLILVI